MNIKRCIAEGHRDWEKHERSCYTPDQMRSYHIVWASYHKKTQKNRNLRGGSKKVIRFLSKKVPCHCLNEQQEEGKHQTRVMLQLLECNLLFLYEMLAMLISSVKISKKHGLNAKNSVNDTWKKNLSFSANISVTPYLVMLALTY